MEVRADHCALSVVTDSQPHSDLVTQRLVFAGEVKSNFQLKDDGGREETELLTQR